jgi:phosphoglycerate kinase
MDLLRGITRLETLPLEGRRVMVRADLDCPMTPEGRVADDSRLHALLPTIRYAITQGAKVVLAGSLGQPAGRRVPELTMAPVGERLAELLDLEIFLPEETVGDGPRKVVMERVDGEVVLLENLAFQSEEESDDDVFAQRLAVLCDVYVNDALLASGRRLASTRSVAKHVNMKACGLLLQKELTSLNRITAGSPEGPFTLLVGGARFSEKIGLMNILLGKVKNVLVGGVTAATFLAARGVAVGRTQVEADRFELANQFLSRARLRGVEVLLPVDVVVAGSACDGSDAQVVPVELIPPEAQILDVGPETVSIFAKAIAASRTVFWNGPMGACEQPIFREGTEKVGKALARSRATSIVAGGDTVAAVARLVLTPFLTHVSGGGDSAMALVEGREVPGVEALRDLD